MLFTLAQRKPLEGQYDYKKYLPDRLWKAILKPNVNPIFVWQLLIQPTTKESIRGIATGTSASMKNISKSGLLAIKVVNVEPQLQNQFADYVTGVYKLKQKAVEKLTALQSKKVEIMNRYL